jgi:hypothetical protein
MRARPTAPLPPATSHDPGPDEEHVECYHGDLVVTAARRVSPAVRILP